MAVQSTMNKSVPKGSVVILLTGEHAGKRAVCVGEHSADEIQVTGPCSINGVGQMHVRREEVIVTETVLSIGASVSGEAVDEAVCSEVSRTAMMKEYLQTPFTLREGDVPHKMKF
ncbi:MAG: 60S ribosomal protein L6 [Amphiamblys sp. WSBS2006]|nr:MAG: 60S ribosomal protein L6 [Amphiamblys sp. WSBS2006]